MGSHLAAAKKKLSDAGNDFPLLSISQCRVLEPHDIISQSLMISGRHAHGKHGAWHPVDARRDGESNHFASHWQELAVDGERALAEAGVVAVAGPGPIFRSCDQPALDRVGVDVVDLFPDLVFGPEVVVVAAAALPEAQGFLSVGPPIVICGMKCGASLLTNRIARLAVDCFIVVRIALML